MSRSQDSAAAVEREQAEHECPDSWDDDTPLPTLADEARVRLLTRRRVPLRVPLREVLR